MTGITASPVKALPVAIVDVETTGLHPNGDRIIEIAIVRQDPDTEPRLALDTLINPRQRVTATEIHGITDRDVRDAPTFEDIAPAVAEALSGAVFASYNVYFDSKFIAAELARAGTEDFPPHVCLMYMRPMLGLGRRCTLSDACRDHGVPHRNAHHAGADAMASAELWKTYLGEMKRLKIQTYGDLAKRKSYKFTKSFSAPLFDRPLRAGTQIRMKSRSGLREYASDSPAPTPQERRAEYWEALKAVLADLHVEDAEGVYLAEKRRSLQLGAAEVRSLHARALAGMLADMTDDHLIDDDEVSQIADLAHALRQLGWFPGDPLVAEGGGVGAERGWFSRWFGRDP